jgi:hypothetical protein
MFKLHNLKMFMHTTKCKLGLMHYALCLIMNATYSIWKGWKLGIVVDCCYIHT